MWIKVARMGAPLAGRKNTKARKRIKTGEEKRSTKR